MQLADISAVLFDFDGVLAESVEVKTQAFVALYEQYGPEILDQVVTYHLYHGGISRYEKIRYFHEVLLGKKLMPDEEAELGERFSQQVEAAVIASEWVIGAREFLDAHCRALPLFIVSGTPEDELKRIIEKRGMAHYFVSVHGSPATKGELIREIVASRGFRPERVLMVGDSITDYSGAETAGVDFVGRVPAGHKNPFPEAVAVIRDLAELTL